MISPGQAHTLPASSPGAGTVAAGLQIDDIVAPDTELKQVGLAEAVSCFQKEKQTLNPKQSTERTWKHQER